MSWLAVETPSTVFCLDCKRDDADGSQSTRDSQVGVHDRNGQTRHGGRQTTGSLAQSARMGIGVNPSSVILERRVVMSSQECEA